MPTYLPFMVSQERFRTTIIPVKQPQVACYGRTKDNNRIRGYRAKAHLSFAAVPIFLKGHLRKPLYSAISMPYTVNLLTLVRTSVNFLERSFREALCPF